MPSRRARSKGKSAEPPESTLPEPEVRGNTDPPEGTGAGVPQPDAPRAREIPSLSPGKLLEAEVTYCRAHKRVDERYGDYLSPNFR